MNYIFKKSFSEEISQTQFDKTNILKKEYLQKLRSLFNASKNLSQIIKQEK